MDRGVRGEDGVGMGKGNTRGQLSGPPGKVGTAVEGGCARGEVRVGAIVWTE